MTMAVRIAVDAGAGNGMASCVRAPFAAMMMMAAMRMRGGAG